MGPGRYSCCKDESIRPSLVLCPLEEGIFGAKTRGKKQQQLDKVVVLDWSYDQSRDLRSDASIRIAYSRLSNFLWGSKFLPPEWGHALMRGLGWGSTQWERCKNRPPRPPPELSPGRLPQRTTSRLWGRVGRPLSRIPPCHTPQQPSLFQRLDRSLTLSPTSVLAML